MIAMTQYAYQPSMAWLRLFPADEERYACGLDFSCLNAHEWCTPAPKLLHYFRAACVCLKRGSKLLSAVSENQ
jgi:hypothetical protein